MGRIGEAQELKCLQGQLAKELANCNNLKSELAVAQRKHHLSQATCKSLEARIVELQTEAPAPIVSEHALLRYLERVKGFDLAALRDEILGDGTAASISFAKTGRIKKDGMCLVIKDNVVVTIE
jgi:hypothetical protein